MTNVSELSESLRGIESLAMCEIEVLKEKLSAMELKALQYQHASECLEVMYDEIKSEYETWNDVDCNTCPLRTWEACDEICKSKKSLIQRLAHIASDRKTWIAHAKNTVELPNVKHGDIVYVFGYGMHRKQIFEKQVSGIYYVGDITSHDWNIDVGWGAIDMYSEWFLSQDEADAALKEREKNG